MSMWKCRPSSENFNFKLKMETKNIVGALIVFRTPSTCSYSASHFSVKILKSKKNLLP